MKNDQDKTSALQLIGIAGTLAAGKDTITKALIEGFGYNHVSTGDMVRKVALQRYGSVERPVLYETANQLRREQGAAALVLEAIKEPKPLIVSGLRSLGEAKAIKKHGGMLVFIDAPVEVRYQRMKSRQRDHEVGLSLDEFIEREEKEMYSGPDDSDFNIRGIGEMADITIDSSMPLDQYIDSALGTLGFEGDSK